MEKIKFKHNKKRNTAFLFESLVKELTKAVVGGDKPRQKVISDVIKEHFRKGSILEKELTLYKQLYETKNFPKDIAEKLLNRVKQERDSLNEVDIFTEQSKLIAKINKIIGLETYNNFVPNYKTLATVSQIFNKEIQQKQKILLEQELVQFISEPNQEKKMILETVDSIALKRFIERFNEAYATKLLNEQKELLSRFINYTEDDVDLKLYLNEELGRLKNELKSLLENSLVQETESLKTNIELTLKTLKETKISEINEELIKKVMILQEFVHEAKK
jgi:hypothetical protein